MMTAHQLAVREGLSYGRVILLLGRGRCEGAVRFGNAWAIPEDAVLTRLGSGRPRRKPEEPATEEPTP